MLLPGASYPESEALVDRILTAMRRVYTRQDATMASIGIATSTGPESLDQLLHRADLAMLAVKERGRKVTASSGQPARERLRPATG
jgi:GGDEF domain-containing protein